MTKKKLKKIPTSRDKGAPEEEVDFLFADLFSQEPKERQVLADLMHAARHGHLYLQRKEPLQSKLITEVDETVEWFDCLIGKWKDWYYLQRNWVIESRVAKELQRLLYRDVKPLDLPKSNELNQDQSEAAAKALQYGLVAITGGPGTGKSYLIRKLVAAFLNQRQGKVMLAAPTGKAIGQLKQKLTSEIALFGDQLEIGTLHALLEIKRSDDLLWNDKKVTADLFIVDECSMIDAALWAALFKAVTSRTRLVLVGDQQQLPPVEAGTLFGEICRYFENHQLPCYARLEKTLRTKQAELLQWAAAVRCGNILAGAALQPGLDLNKWVERFPKPQAGKPNFAHLFDQLKSFRILSCLRQGSFGVDAINEAISKRIRQCFRGKDYWPVPLLMTRSDRELGIFNGDTGLLIKQSGFPYIEHGDQVVFETETGYREIPASLLPAFEYAYCLSVHKSQGSEYKQVALVVPPGSEKFGREILYTGITRARQSIEIIGDEAVIGNCLAHSSQKRSGLSKRLALTSPAALF
ncbi:MAG: AAA family ATPase [Chlamydiota bacterium]